MYALMCLFVYIEFIGVTLAHKTIQVSSAQLNKTSPAPCIVHPSPQAKKTLSVPFFPALSTSTYPHPLVLRPLPHCVHGLCIHVLWLILSPSFIWPPLPTAPRQLSVCSMYPCLCFSVVCQFIFSLDSSYK